VELSTDSNSSAAIPAVAIVPQAGALRRLLRIPLLAKLAGANLLVVLGAWAAVYATNRTTAGDWRVVGVITAVLAVGLVVNLTLVAVALRPIRDLERTAMRIWAGDLETRVPLSPISDADLEQVAGTVNYLLAALARDRARVRMLASEVVRTSDRERARVGRELHDSVAQAIAALRYQLIAIEREAADTMLADRLEAVRLSAGDLLEQVRVLSQTVHPQILDDLGLVPALRQLVRKTNGRAPTTVTLTTATEADVRAIPTDAAAALYWIAQEAIANANRHAFAREIEVRIGLAADGIEMQVNDDGAGFDTAAAERDGSTMGLFTMRERATLANGTFEIVSTPHHGTSVRVRIPVVRTATEQPQNSAAIFQTEAH
jgi:two-component system sensor histidine kinase UhpB